MLSEYGGRLREMPRLFPPLNDTARGQTHLREGGFPREERRVEIVFQKKVGVNDSLKNMYQNYPKATGMGRLDVEQMQESNKRRHHGN